MKKIMFIILCMGLFMVPCFAQNVTVIVNNKNTIIINNKVNSRSRVRAPGMYNTGNYLRDLHSYKHRKRLQKASTRYFLKHRMNSRKNYRPARKSRSMRNIRIRRSK